MYAVVCGQGGDIGSVYAGFRQKTAAEEFAVKLAVESDPSVNEHTVRAFIRARGCWRDGTDLTDWVVHVCRQTNAAKKGKRR